MTALAIQEREAPLFVNVDVDGDHHRQDCKNEINQWQDCMSLTDCSLTSEESHESLKSPDPVTFRRLIIGNRAFRLFLSSFMLARLGGWLTYIASITLIEDILSLEGQSSRSAVSTLVAVRFMLIVLLSPFGGALADGRDKRQSMIWLDVIGAACPLLFLVAMRARSIVLVYAITVLQQSVTGLYEPCKSSLTPLLVCGEEELKTAVTLIGLCWSVLGALGSSLGGLIVSSLGLQACFVVDCATYLLSAILLWAMGGDTASAVPTTKHTSKSLGDLVRAMTEEGVEYIRGSSWGALVLLKASGGIVCGAADILNVAFSGDSALRLGGLFACIGIGSLIGSSIVNASADLKQPPSVQKAAIMGLGIAVLGCMGTGLFHPFISICFFSVLRSVGSSLYWINSSLLIPDTKILSTRYAWSCLCSGWRTGAVIRGLFSTALRISSRSSG